MNETRSQDIALQALLDGIHMGQVVLPDFQRDFDWSDGDVRALLATVLMNWPVGSILLIEGVSNREFYAPREFEEAPTQPTDIVYIVLDGQQRLTSLYHALYGRGPLRYFLKIDHYADYGDVSAIDELLVSHTEETWSMLSTPELQRANDLIPLTALASPDSFYEWRDRLESEPAEIVWLTAMYRKYLAHLPKFRVPAVIVDSRISPVAIARVFQRVNQGGMKLGTFDLMVAKTYSPTFNLRAAWEKSKVDHPSLNKHLRDDGLPILSVLALLELGNVRQSSVLKLPEGRVIDNWEQAARHYATAIEFVEEEFGVLSSDWLPYGQMLTVLAAVSYERDLRSMRDVVARWFWTTGFGHRYDSASNTRAVADYKKLRGGDEATLEQLRFVIEEMVESTKGKRGAVHRAYLCVLGSSAASERRVFNTAPTPASIFRRRTGAPALHLRTLTFAIQDGESNRVDSIGMADVDPDQYFNAAERQIERVSEFLKSNAGIDARIVSEAEEERRIAESVSRPEGDPDSPSNLQS
ncbi:GmrSD restriction endonuclease domain-containing protein [Paeniglutamicibacter antarcticus]|uniref:GmrSD restriction endonucleases N-terminal domain-containing protein n=1 Tax=Paeniglutamicibacter antarcticus TaxID=494023 RepID=A0ABP9TS94_9MICC